MIGTDITKNDSTPERVFTTDDGYTGPVLADITCPDGVVHVTVDPSAILASVRVRTDDPTGPAATAVRNTRIHQTAERLTVVVPPLPPTTQHFNGGGVRISGNNFSTGTVNGRGTTVIGGTIVGGTVGVEVLVTLPADSGVKSTSENGSLHVYGMLAALEAETSNGSIHAETVGRIKAEANNGSVKVDHYAGSAARIRSGNGSVVMTVAPAATCQITVKAGNGSVKLYGVRNRSDLDVRASAGNGTVKKF